jgi:hypothetical protein
MSKSRDYQVDFSLKIFDEYYVRIFHFPHVYYMSFPSDHPYNSEMYNW